MPLTLTLIAANVIFSIIGWTQPGFMDKYMFHVGKILKFKEYKRMVTGAFLHADPTHLFFNMMVLYSFGELLEPTYRIVLGNFGPVAYLILYFGSMLGGDLLALLLKRHQFNYSAIGASGAISGIVFAAIILNPNGKILFLFFIPMVMWLYGLLYVIYSIYGIRNQWGNIGHDAHLGGAMAGMFITYGFLFRLASDNWMWLIYLGGPTALFVLLAQTRSEILSKPFQLFHGLFRRRPTTSRPTNNPNPNPPATPEKRVKQDGLEINMKTRLQAEMDELLDKVSKKGINGLTMKERQRLDELANYLNKPNYREGGRAPSE